MDPNQAQHKELEEKLNYLQFKAGITGEVRPAKSSQNPYELFVWKLDSPYRQSTTRRGCAECIILIVDILIAIANDEGFIEVNRKALDHAGMSINWRSWRDFVDKL